MTAPDPRLQVFEHAELASAAPATLVLSGLAKCPGRPYDVEWLAALGRDVERLVLSRAVSLHAQDRVLLNGSRTVVLG